MSPFPTDVRPVDVYISFPQTNPSATTDRYRSVLKDADSQATERHPAEYMFKDIPAVITEDDDPVAVLLAELDRHGIELALVNLDSPATPRALEQHPDRFRATVNVDPKDVSGAVRKIRDSAARYRVHGVVSFPGGVQVAINDARYYPVYQTCVDLDIPIIMNAGVAGPRFPSVDIQYVGHFDRVCYEFPELKIVMCHGSEPWEELAVKLMLKYPGLHYCTSAFAPKYYPKAIIDFATRPRLAEVPARECDACLPPRRGPVAKRRRSRSADSDAVRLRRSPPQLPALDALSPLDPCAQIGESG
ncbi:MAG: amidohydrolase family protein [Solirubrobacteraceae bacterium]